ncbi:hypothetical protein K2F40_10860 [Clostridium sp. CM028]|uniref:hypothetical protein n=1 Tax=Clostridium sp. CM028 TaxID=2851575 RepID=UPI001C6E22F0|nr:hypothetical protein [Clostridium sp. CM028]MBW9149460.1 hypothetical protein [Clostridium sp. CM028]WLC62186.1 hypothetical protein KTC94_02510 [Clostridium sp. CM028]
MRICSPCLFYDSEDHIWSFYVNDDRNLMYSIMYDENKWTKENKIDNEVIDFTVNFDIDNKIYIIYSVGNSDLKYCEWEQNKWFGKTIYSFENEGYEMTELNVITIGEQMHIFFIGKNSIKRIQCSLMHLCLNKNESLFNTIDTIPFLKEVFCHYQVQNLENGDLSLVFIKHEKNEIVINFTEYKNNNWSIPRRLYGIIGNSINFCTLLYVNKINIINLSKEGSLYFIEHVLIEPDGKMKSYKIHEGCDKPTNLSLVEISGVLWSIWSEGKNILTSSYKNQWSEPNKDYTQLNNEISLYKFLSLSKKHSNIQCKYMIGTNPPEINLLLPQCKDNDSRDDFPKLNSVAPKTKLDSNVKKNKLDIQEEILALKKINKDLEKKLIDLQIKYQQKLRILAESDNNFFKISNAKKKAEEKLNIIAEIQQTSIKKLEVMKIEKISTDRVINELKNKSEQLTNEYEGLKKQKMFKDVVVNELNNKLERLTSEKEGLKQDLKYEKNIGIVDRILKKRPVR